MHTLVEFCISVALFLRNI